MKKSLIIALAALPVFITACASPKPPVAFHGTDSNAVVIKCVDNRSSELIAPTPTGLEAHAQVMNKVSAVTGAKTAVVILENYNEEKVGDEFRNRSTPWFIGLRTLGYDHVVFLQGNGTDSPEGLATIARYD
jgi:hypothetical protein